MKLVLCCCSFVVWGTLSVGAQAESLETSPKLDGYAASLKEYEAKRQAAVKLRSSAEHAAAKPGSAPPLNLDAPTDDSPVSAGETDSDDAAGEEE